MTARRVPHENICYEGSRGAGHSVDEARSPRQKGIPARIVRGVLTVPLYFQQPAFPSTAHVAVVRLAPRAASYVVGFPQYCRELMHS
jgi:hypothetical protein